MMATSAAKDEDEVEFVSEGPLRPVLEYIDLLSDGEDETAGVPGTVEDQVDRQKAKVASTLDRLARQVAVEKKERAEKCRAFREKMVSQQAHGRQGLVFSHSDGESRDAKRCVDMWLKMPGLRPGTLHTGFRKGRRSAPHPTMPSSSSAHTCPVINCSRVFDSVPLLEGHLKRFDHSPCDPTILLKGAPSESFACIACCQRFHTKEAWEEHLRSKASSPNPKRHVSSQTCQLIQCFACPCCFLLFNIRDQCLQHMGAKNHFTQSLKMSEGKSSAAVPIPIPRYAKNRLIVLCKEVPFCVRCSSCRKVLSSHMDARAHFNVHCRQGGAIAEAEKTVLQIMRKLRAYGHCLHCQQTFLRDGDAENHKHETKHEVDTFSTVEQSLLYYCDHHDTLRGRRGPPSAAVKHTSSQIPTRERDKGAERERAVGSPAKRRKCQMGTVTWACECGLHFPEEAAAHRHLLAANQIFHKCGVCGKEMGEASIARLHMSRFHGGAHLSNFLFWCRRCRVDMPRQEDILLHVGEAHTGHTFCQEQEAMEDESISVSELPLSTKFSETLPSKASATETVAGPSVASHEERWLCRMCEDLFESEAAVRAHCEDVGAHSFQRFMCGDCGQRFFKEATLRRHCDREHGGRVHLRHFCGLCDSMQHDSQEEFLRHYRSLHACDYYRMEEAGPGADTPSPVETSQSAKPQCPCMATEKSKAEQKAVFTRCMKQLAGSGQCTYVCPPCGLQTAYYIQLKVHLRREHEQGSGYHVMCRSCPESCEDVPSFHTHYHSQHCLMEPCLSQRPRGGEAITISKVLNAEEICPEANAVEFEEVKHAVALNSEESKGDAEGDNGEYDEDLKHALALSAEEARRQSDRETELDREMEEAMKRSLLEF
ncbi:hypothetical protein AGOR_G00118770 [Albula goreensis]|uniref:C2H2-type domain-containing protein n=1 Tax=Albula goreensis TaxID=1534307 RepID=A0A8T3DD43_9TELE|nr:hypothetical protein AGOR_G00118770 [Albula goreensis]